MPGQPHDQASPPAPAGWEKNVRVTFAEDPELPDLMVVVTMRVPRSPSGLVGYSCWGDVAREIIVLYCHLLLGEPK